MSIFRPAFSAVIRRNLVRPCVYQAKNVYIARQYATKIEPTKKSSATKLLLFGVSFSLFKFLSIFIKSQIFSTFRD